MGQTYRDGTLTGDIAGGGALWLPASEFIASAAGPALEVVDAIHHGFLLDNTAAEDVSVGFFCPYGWNTVDFFYYGYNAGAGAGGVALGYYLEDKADGGSLVSETPTSVVDVTFTAAAEDILDIITGDTGVVVSPGTYHALKVGRLPANAADTLANDWGLLGVLLRRAS